MSSTFHQHFAPGDPLVTIFDLFNQPETFCQKTILKLCKLKGTAPYGGVLFASAESLGIWPRPFIGLQAKN